MPWYCFVVDLIRWFAFDVCIRGLIPVYLPSSVNVIHSWCIFVLASTHPCTDLKAVVHEFINKILFPFYTTMKISSQFPLESHLAALLGWSTFYDPLHSGISFIQTYVILFAKICRYAFLRKNVRKCTGRRYRMKHR